jgi:hypothetical protein
MVAQMRWTNEQLAELLSRNPALRISESPLKRRIVSIERRIDAQPFEVAESGNGMPQAVKTSRTNTKYRNKRTEVDGITFDSKKESERYRELKILEKAGAVKNLTLQPRYAIIVNDIKICDYVADFTYQTRMGETLVEDCKGVRTPVYRLKRRLMKAAYGIEILES